MAHLTGYISPSHCIQHDTGPGHPERAARLESINAHLKEEGMLADLVELESRAATVEELGLVHDTGHVRRVINLLNRGVSELDPDTIVSRETLEASYLAAGAAISGVDALYAERGPRQVFCGVRPPGHHAESDRSMGFCIFNNVAVAAAHALAKGLAQRIFVLDWDVHHGNGTQEIFAESSEVFYYSLHQSPFYPGTGSDKDLGWGKGRGYTLNRPLDAGSSDDTYLRWLEKDLSHIADTFKPDLVIVSAGFDAHDQDPLAGMCVTTHGFGRFTELAKAMAQQTAEGRLLSVLEGGYHLSALSASVARHLRVLMD